MANSDKSSERKLKTEERIPMEQPFSENEVIFSLNNTLFYNKATSPLMA